MAIERMKSIWLFARRGEARSVLDHLARTGLCHVVDCRQTTDSDLEGLGIEGVFPDASHIERRVQLLRETLAVLSPFHRTSRDFLENFITTPLEVTKAEVVGTLNELEVEKMHAEVKRRERDHNEAVSALEEARQALKAQSDLDGVSSLLIGGKTQRVTAALLGRIPAAKAAVLQSDERLPDTCAFAVVAQRKRNVILQATCLAEDRESFEALLREHGFERVPPSEETLTVKDVLTRLRDEVKRGEADEAETRSRLVDIAKANRRAVETALGYWEERLRIARSAAMLAESKRLTLVKGYVRERDLTRFREKIAHELPHVEMDIRDPEPGEKVPVSLKNSKLFAPAQFTLSMFGMPGYFTFDPTPIVFFNFTIFFGICFGDALYGLGLIAIGWLLARKYRAYTGLRYLFTLLAYAGIPTLAVGVLTGSWGGSLLSKSWLGDPNPFFAADNPLVLFAERLTVFALMDKLMVALVIALGVGIANQLLGLLCLGVNKYQKGDRVGAVLDTVFWLVALPAAVVLCSTLFTTVPPTAKNVAWATLGIGVVGLVLTQGRQFRNPFARFGLGLVSLYGVAGSYGFSSFLNDVLSYSRLLALGLATSVVGMAFNILANMARFTDIAALNAVIVLVLLIFGHGANFFLSILGSFVHSVRLIFVEFFGRFYEAESPAFAPIGVWSGRIRVVDSVTVWSD